MNQYERDELRKLCEPSAVNWFRGFYRLWLAISLLWVAAVGGATVYVTCEQDAFDRKIAAARAADPEAEQHGGLLFDYRGNVCTGEQAMRDSYTCTTDPRGPHARDEFTAYWLATFGIPGLFYGLLREAAWILGGFGRNA